jgi:hypothetical protein
LLWPSPSVKLLDKFNKANMYIGRSICDRPLNDLF